MSGLDTVECDVQEPPDATPGARERVRVWRGLTGSLVAGWVAVTLLLIGAQVVAGASEGEGPGMFAVLGHVVGTVLALGAQYAADHTRGRPAALAGSAVVVLTGALLWLFWYS